MRSGITSSLLRPGAGFLCPGFDCVSGLDEAITSSRKRASSFAWASCSGVISLSRSSPFSGSADGGSDLHRSRLRKVEGCGMNLGFCHCSEAFQRFKLREDGVCVVAKARNSRAKHQGCCPDRRHPARALLAAYFTHRDITRWRPEFARLDCAKSCQSAIPSPGTSFQTFQWAGVGSPATSRLKNAAAFRHRIFSLSADEIPSVLTMSTCSLGSIGTGP